MKANTTTVKKLPSVALEMNVVLTLTSREILMAVKAPQSLIMSLVWPILMLGMFGSQLSQNLGATMGFDFNSFMLVGMLINALFMGTTNGVTSIVEDRENDFTQEMFVSPVSRYSILLGKIVGASVMSYVQFFATLLIGFLMGATISAAQFWMILAVSPFMCLAAGSLGMLLVGFVSDASTAGTLAMTISMIQTFLSGALIPVSNSSGIMAVISRILPMTYCIDYARGMFYAGASGADSAATLYAPGIDLIIIVAFTLVFFVLGTLNFVRKEKNK